MVLTIIANFAVFVNFVNFAVVVTAFNPSHYSEALVIVSQVYSPRLFKVQDTLGVSKFRLCWFSCLVFVYCRFPFKPSVRSYSFVIGSSRSALVLLVVLFMFAFLSIFRRCLWFS